MELPTHDSPYDEDLAGAVQAARRGAGVIRDHTGSAGDVRAKDTNDFVTAVDDAAQAQVLDVLRDRFPNDEVLAEEGEEPETIPRIADGRRWIVDPLDGTTNFMHGIPPYAVSIALQEQRDLRVGVVLDVPHDTLYTAVKGHGLQVDGRPAGVSRTNDFGAALLATGFPYRRFEHTGQYVDVLETLFRTVRGVRRHGAASMDLAWLARGRFDGFFETGLRCWDVAAGILLVREGGGRVTDYHGNGGLSPVFDQQVCASNGNVHGPLLQHLEGMSDVRL